MINIKINSNYVSDLFRSMARQKGVGVKVYFEGIKLYGIILFTDRKGQEPFLKIFDNKSCDLSIGSRITITCLYRNIYLRFDTTIYKNENEDFFIEKPIEVYSNFERLLYRYTLTGEEISFVEINAVKYQLNDISGKGLSFFTLSQDTFSCGDIVRNATLYLQTVSVNVDINIRHIYFEESKQMFVVGVSFFDLAWKNFYLIFKYVFQKMYPMLRNMSLYKYEDIYELYHKSGYLALKEDMNESKMSFNDMIKVLPLIDSIPQLSANFTYVNPESNKLLTGSSVIRIYKDTYLSQHLASIPESRHNLRARSDLYSAINDYLLNNQYFGHYLAYFDSDLNWHKEFFAKIGEYIGDKNKFVFEEIDMYWFNMNEYKKNIVSENFDYQVELLTNPEEFLNYCKYNMEKLEINTYNYNENDIYLEEIKSIYEIVGLELSRNIFKVSTKMNGNKNFSVSVAYIIAESYTSGLNLFNLLDSVKVYFKTFVDRKNIFLSSIKHLIDFYEKYNKWKFNIAFKRAHDETENVLDNIPGMGSRVKAGRVMANRMGGSEYRNLLNLNSR